MQVDFKIIFYVRGGFVMNIHKYHSGQTLGLFVGVNQTLMKNKITILSSMKLLCYILIQHSNRLFLRSKVEGGQCELLQTSSCVNLYHPICAQSQRFDGARTMTSCCFVLCHTHQSASSEGKKTETVFLLDGTTEEKVN